MRRIDGEEGRILRKYIDGRVMDDEDGLTIRRLRRTGLIHCGISIERGRRTAKTTMLGYRMI